MEASSAVMMYSPSDITKQGEEKYPSPILQSMLHNLML